jgi:hypothetical protein
VPNVGKVVCEASTKLPGRTVGREEGRRKQLAKLHGTQLSKAPTKVIEEY